jgi:hypothetical protein
VCGLIHQKSSALAFKATAQQHLPLLLAMALLNDVRVPEACQLHVLWGVGDDGFLLFVPPDQIHIT